jgi:hypothetical protein
MARGEAGRKYVCAMTVNGMPRKNSDGNAKLPFLFANTNVK